MRYDAPKPVDRAVALLAKRTRGECREESVPTTKAPSTLERAQHLVLIGLSFLATSLTGIYHPRILLDISMIDAEFETWSRERLAPMTRSLIRADPAGPSAG